MGFVLVGPDQLCVYCGVCAWRSVAMGTNKAAKSSTWKRRCPYT